MGGVSPAVTAVLMMRCLLRPGACSSRAAGSSVGLDARVPDVPVETCPIPAVSVLAGLNPAPWATAADAAFSGSTRITASVPPSLAAYWETRRTARVARPRPLQNG
jgi:hypothetical protein